MSDKIIKYGRYMRGGQHSAAVVSTEGIAPAVMENHGIVTAIVVEEKEKCSKDYVRQNRNDDSRLS